MTFLTFVRKKNSPAYLSHFIILHIYNLNDETRKSKKKTERKKKTKKEKYERQRSNWKDYLGKDRLSHLISSRSSVEYQVNRTE